MLENKLNISKYHYELIKNKTDMLKKIKPSCFKCLESKLNFQKILEYFVNKKKSKKSQKVKEKSTNF